MGATRDEAEDLVQSALIKCYVRWERVERADDPIAYVHRIVLNTLRDAKRRFWNRENPSADVASPATPSDPTTTWDTAHSLHDSLQRLPHGQRAVLVLRYYCDLTEQQVARVLDVPLGTVKSRAARALSALEADLNLDKNREIG
jgi:RNA polymerase sigma-70 factor (sigma-E family)